jgi:glycosyltransferase
MKVSIITVTYNSEKTLRDTLESIELQTYKDIEYIIIDGGSTDNTLKLINEVSTRVTKCLSESDNGIYDALNKGINLSTGDIIGFVHSDDLLARPNIIETIVSRFHETKADVVYGDLVFFEKNQIDIIKRYWRSGPFKRSKLSLGWAPPHPSFYMRRELYKDDGYFDLSYRIAADYDQMVRILKRDDIKVIYVPQVFVKMRLGGESTRIDNAISSTKEIVEVMKNHNVNWKIAIIIRKISKLMQLFAHK